MKRRLSKVEGSISRRQALLLKRHPHRLAQASDEELAAMLAAFTPKEHAEFIQGLTDEQLDLLADRVGVKPDDEYSTYLAGLSDEDFDAVLIEHGMYN